MFERVSRAAERVATGVSRRGFLGRLGQGALAVAGLLVGGLGTAAANPTRGFVCCKYYCITSRFCDRGGRYQICVPAGTPCPYPYDSRCCRLIDQAPRNHCNGC